MKHIDEVRKEASNGPFEVRNGTDVHDGNGIFACYHHTNAALIAHCLNTHQMILDALKDAEAFLRLRNLGANADKLNCSVIRPAIEAAENVEVSE